MAHPPAGVCRLLLGVRRRMWYACYERNSSQTLPDLETSDSETGYFHALRQGNILPLKPTLRDYEHSRPWNIHADQNLIKVEFPGDSIYSSSTSCRYQLHNLKSLIPLSQFVACSETYSEGYVVDKFNSLSLEILSWLPRESEGVERYSELWSTDGQCTLAA